MQAIALDWKWVFIYPGQGVASVDRLTIPVGRPVRIRLTSGTVMQSLMIPQLAGQVYAMAGMTTQLHIMASRPGTFRGANTQYNGDGFAHQRFDVVALPAGAYDRWLTQARAADRPLDAATWRRLSARSVIAQPVVFSSVTPQLFDRVVAQAGDHGHKRIIDDRRVPRLPGAAGAVRLDRSAVRAGMAGSECERDRRCRGRRAGGDRRHRGRGVADPLSLWGRLWTEWLTSLDHKKIGIMYIVTAFVMLARALVEAVLMRVQQAVAIGDPGFLSPDHFGQLFSTHGSIMIFFMAMPFLTGLINNVMPLQIGARDMAFPWANSIALWLTIGAAGLMMASLVVGQFSTGGWSGYPPYTERAFSPASASITGSGR